MKVDRNSEKFDELISRAISRDKPAFDFDKWKQAHRKEIEIFESQTANRKVSRSALSMDIWSAILKAKVGRIAVAACIIVAVLIVLRPSSNSFDGTTAAYAKVGEAIKNVPWMRITYTSRLLDPNGNVRPDHQGSTDIWYSFNSQILIQKYSSGHITFIDYDKKEVYNYNPDSKRIVLSALPGDKLPFGANSPWSWLERNIQRMMPFGGDVTRKRGQYDGQEVEVFKIVATPKRGVAAVRGKIFVDKVTSLPIAEERIYIDTKIDKPQCEEKGTFEYPKRGPADIYDLGLSRDIPTINSLELPPWQDIEDVYESYRRQAPERYISIVTRELRIRGAPIESVEICYADGAHSRQERHFIFRPGAGFVGPQWAEQAAEIGNTFDSILKWSQAFKAAGEISISIFDKSGGYNAHRQDDGTWKTTKQIFDEDRELTAYDFWNLCSIRRIGWPEIRGYADVIQNDFARENNLIRIEAGGRQFYLNPDRDYICQMQANSGGGTTEVKEFAQTREGKWYPKRVEGLGIANTIYLETNPVLPEGIFDPNNLPKEDR